MNTKHGIAHIKYEHIQFSELQGENVKANINK